MWGGGESDRLVSWEPRRKEGEGCVVTWPFFALVGLRLSAILRVIKRQLRKKSKTMDREISDGVRILSYVREVQTRVESVRHYYSLQTSSSIITYKIVLSRVATLNQISSGIINSNSLASSTL